MRTRFYCAFALHGSIQGSIPEARLEELTDLLARRGPSSARELLAELRIAQPAFSRLIRQAGDRLVRTGQARRTRYALTRSLRDLGPRLPLHRVGESGRVLPIGEVVLLAGGGHLVLAEDREVLFRGLPPFAAEMAPQ